MEHFALVVRRAFARLGAIMAPHFRQIVRFLALPYCYFFLVDWEHCPASRPKVLVDMLYIFFVLRYFPDNYYNCQLYEQPRSHWWYYYGSGYHPYQRHQLRKRVQPREYQVLFEDKEVCQQLCLGAGLRVPRCVGVIDPRWPLVPQVQAMTSGQATVSLIAKPVSGASGAGVFMIRKRQGDIAFESAGSARGVDVLALTERVIVQEIVAQHESLKAIHAGSVNTVRVLTLWTMSGVPMVLSAAMRFGVGTAFIDNWSAGGIAVGVDLVEGRLLSTGYDRHGRRYSQHPDSGVALGQVRVPLWAQVVEISEHVQDVFPYHPMLGLDLAVAPDGPVLLEINAFPDLVFQEQTAGPLLRSSAVAREFACYDLLINRHQRNLYR